MVAGGPRACQPEPDPAREPLAAALVERRVGDDDPEAGPGRRRQRYGRARRAGHRPGPGDGQPVPLPEVRQEHDPDDVPVGQHPRRGADAALPAEAAHAGAGTDGALLGRTVLPTERCAWDSAAATSSSVTCMQRASVQPRVVALPHDRNDDVVDADRRLLGHQQAAGGVVHTADLHRRGEEDRCLRHAPLVDLGPPGHSPAPLSTATPAGTGGGTHHRRDARRSRRYARGRARPAGRARRTRPSRDPARRLGRRRRSSSRRAAACRS